ncbi:hypothetical protein P9847_23125 [Paenibacillus chibensis]|uniref:Uncharacterized protein n=1 Tax=Paenibacillus chibensis TaxID=59846 RepID=A0ABU6Q0S3_9BACL|nr:hypothetical protein [Paenibacillus chibensis]
MKPNKKAKWIIGVSGVAFSAFVLSQFGVEDHTTTDLSQTSQMEQNDQQSFLNRGSSSNGEPFADSDGSSFMGRRHTDGTTRRS